MPEVRTIAVLGPSNPAKVGRAVGIPLEVYRSAAAHAGALLAQRGDRLVVVPDRGVAIYALDAYLAAGGHAAIGLCPSSGVSESDANGAIAQNRRKCHHILSELSWYEQHHAIGRLSDAMVCIGLSCGTIAEIAWTKWNKGPRVAAVAGTMSALPPEMLAEVAVDVLESDAISQWLDERPSERVSHPLAVQR